MGKTVCLILAVALMISAALVGCGPEEAPPAAPPPAAPPPAAPPPAAPPPPVEKTPWEKLVEAAKAEGTVNVYTGFGAPTEKAIKEDFTATYGIAVETVAGKPASIWAKIEEEQITGVYIADVWARGAGEITRFLAAGYAQPPLIALPSLKDVSVFRMDPYDQLGTEGKAVWFHSCPNATVLINTNLVKEEITSYYDLLDPKWKGQIIMTDPRIHGPGSSELFVGMKVVDEDFWKEFARQDPLLERSHQRVIDAVVLGEKPIAFYYSNSRAFGALEAGAPVKFVHLKEGSHMPNMGACVVKNAPHPNAATLLVNWMLTVEGQLSICKSRGEVSFRKDITSDWVIPERSWDAPYKALPGPVTAADSEGAIAFAKRIFGEA